MSYLHFNSVFDHGASAGDEAVSPPFGELPPQAPTTDRAIDTALRSVPLPLGLMTRLGMLVYTVADKPADQMDRLGC